ncbi:GEVED domain-containing protein [Epilithonimonas sp.]|uniref:T9SS type A sorting domain-containing protein n=1 Tax=Epilithonimonas sp. TaxID=2894511 RepID=UPI00289B4784|nr:GEVED domain-containing protein [Epilithonimonas sp.]
MKKILFSLLALAGLSTTNTVNAQYVVFQDSFESYTDFAISNVGSWTLLDVDNSPSGGFNGITFPNGNGTNKAFQVFNSTTTTPVLTPTSTSNWTARTGQKTMASFYLTSGASNNDWLISPKIQLAADGGALSFWAKSCDTTYGAEKYRVYISTTGTAVSDFTPLSAVQTTPSDITWHEFTTSLSAYAGQQVYIAIQCSSTDQFGFAVDDFKVTTSIAPTTAPACSALTSPANAAVDVPFTATTLSWALSSGADSYDVYLDTNPNPTTLVGNVTGTSYTSATSLALSTTYYWKVIPKNTIGAATGCTVYSFTTAAATYCTAGATSTSFEKISNVTFANINNNSTSTAGYENFTSIVGNVTAGSTYTFTATFTGTSYPEDQVLVWIDLNNDKDFDDAGEQVLVTPTKASPWTGSITIPATASIGTTRMRVRLDDSSSATSNTSPCGTSTYGQVEDYTLNIGTLAVSEVGKSTIKAYPNPVKDIFTIEAQGSIQSVKVFDIAGKQLLTKELNETKSQIDFSKFNAGVYVVTTTMADGTTSSTKVIKK